MLPTRFFLRFGLPFRNFVLYLLIFKILFECKKYSAFQISFIFQPLSRSFGEYNWPLTRKKYAYRMCEKGDIGCESIHICFWSCIFILYHWLDGPIIFYRVLPFLLGDAGNLRFCERCFKAVNSTHPKGFSMKIRISFFFVIRRYLSILATGIKAILSIYP